MSTTVSVQLHVVNCAEILNTSCEIAWGNTKWKNSVHFILFLEQLFMLTKSQLRCKRVIQGGKKMIN